MNRKTMTLNLSVNEMEALERLCEEKSISKTALIRQALRLYQSVHSQLGQGYNIYAENPQLERKRIIIV